MWNGCVIMEFYSLKFAMLRLIIIGSLWNSYPYFVPIGITLLSGTLVGIIVSYSQSYIASDISEETNKRNLLLDEIKKMVGRFETEGGSEALVNLYNADEDPSLTADEMHTVWLLKKSRDHWKNFSQKFNLYSKAIKKENEKIEVYNKNRLLFIEHAANETIQEFLPLVIDTNVMEEFIQGYGGWPREELNEIELDKNVSDKMSPKLREIINNAAGATGGVFTDKSDQPDVLLKNLTDCLNLNSKLDLNFLHAFFEIWM